MKERFVQNDSNRFGNNSKHFENKESIRNDSNRFETIQIDSKLKKKDYNIKCL